MPKMPEEKMYIVCIDNAYLAPLKTMGPIVSPVEATKSQVSALVLAGANVSRYNPVTKTYHKLDSLTDVTVKPEPQMQEVKYEECGVHTPAEPEVVEPAEEFVCEECMVPPVEATVSEEVVEEVITEESVEDEVVVEETADKFTFKEDGTVDETAIDWSVLTKNQRRELRKEINAHNEAVAK